MIDFAKITKTLDGYDCHYFGTRESYGVTVHCFAVWDLSFGCIEINCDDSGNRMRFDRDEWVRCYTSKFQIVKPKKKIEVTGWVTATKGEISGQYYLFAHDSKEDLPQGCFDPQQHTFTFEVDE